MMWKEELCRTYSPLPPLSTGNRGLKGEIGSAGVKGDTGPPGPPGMASSHLANLLLQIKRLCVRIHVYIIIIWF